MTTITDLLNEFKALAAKDYRLQGDALFAATSAVEKVLQLCDRAEGSAYSGEAVFYTDAIRAALAEALGVEP